MNRPIEKLVTEGVLNDILRDFLKKIKEQGGKLSEDNNKEIEILFWKLIKPALGQNNWDGNNYKGSLNTEEINKVVVAKITEALGGSGISKETILKPLKEIFGKKNFDDDEYTGIETIREIIGKENFKDGKLSIPAGWDKEKDLQNLKDNKPYLSEVVKENLGDFKKDVDNRFEASKTELQTKLQEADTKIAQGEQKLTETANTIKKDVEGKSTTLKSEVDAKLTKADKDIQTKLGEVDTKLSKSETDIQTKLKGVDTKLETADKEIKAKLEAVDKKFEPYKTWEKTKEDIIPVIIENLENKNPLWKKFQENLDPENFYSDDPHQDTTPGREGMWKNQADIAKQQARYADEIAAAKLWVKFFKDHNVASDQETIWEKRFPANPEGAEGYYTDAILRAAKLVGTKQPLNDLEKAEILKSPTPDKIEETILNIPKERTKQAWREFFDEVDITNQIKPDWQKNWEESGLNRPQAEIVYKNGWMNDPAKGIIKDAGIETYTTTHYDSEDVKYEIETKNVNPLTHIESELVKCHTFIFKRISSQKDLTKFPDDAEIQDKSRSYDEALIPDNRNYERTIKLRDTTRKELFQTYFKGDNAEPLSEWQEKDFEAWRTADTGLPMTGVAQRKAFDNGWVKPNEIINGRTEYQGAKNIDVLKYKQSDVIKEIATVDKWVGEIKGYTKLRQLDSKVEEIDNIIKHLNLELLPAGSKGSIEKEVADARERLSYYLGDPEDGGIEKSKLDLIEQAIKSEVWEPRNYKPLNTQILNDFINATEGIKVKPDKEWKAGAIDDWLKSKGAYIIPKEITDQEDNLPIEFRGQYLLDFFYKKIKDARGNTFKPDNLDDNSFCVAGEISEDIPFIFGGGTKITPIIKGTQGHLAIGTGVGKSTKVINCLLRGGGIDGISGTFPSRNIILVVPTQVLVEAVYGHQVSWMQNWGCVFHQVWEKGVKVKKGTFTRASEEDISNGEYEVKNVFKSHGKYKVVKNALIPKGETGLSIITGDEFIGYCARQLLVDTKDRNGKTAMDYWVGVKGDKNGWSPEDVERYKQIISTELIDKVNDIVMFDEGHFNSGDYQRAQVQAIYNKYKVIRMSATFPDMEFSITSTYPRENLWAGEVLDPNMKIRKKENGSWLTLDELLRTGKVWMFVPTLKLNPDQEKVLSPISYMAYTSEWNEYVEAVSFGMPRGSLGLVGTDHEVGMNGDVDLVIPGGKVYAKVLEKNFRYGKEKLINISQASGVQQIGRTARFKRGTGLLLSLKWEEFNAKEDVSSAMVNSLFDGEVKHLSKLGYKMLSDIDMLRAGLALPHKFGSPPAEILIGLKVDEKAEANRVENNEHYWKNLGTNKEGKYSHQPLTKIEWRTENEKPDKPDEGLWKKYLGVKETITMDKDKAKDRLLENISTFISENEGFPKRIKVWNQSNLIEYIWGASIKTNKKAILDEVRRVLNGVILKAIESYKGTEYDKVNKTSKKKEIIEQVANYYNIADAMIDISPQKNKEGKMVLTLQIEK